MSPFTDKEVQYLRGQRLGRMATAASNGAPHIVPVGFRVDPESQTIQIGGHGLSQSKKGPPSPRPAGVPGRSKTH